MTASASRHVGFSRSVASSSHVESINGLELLITLMKVCREAFLVAWSGKHGWECNGVVCLVGVALFQLRWYQRKRQGSSVSAVYGQQVVCTIAVEISVLAQVMLQVENTKPESLQPTSILVIASNKTS